MIALQTITGALNIVSIDPEKITAVILFNNQEYNLIYYYDGFSICDIFADDEQTENNFNNEIFEIMEVFQMMTITTKKTKNNGLRPKTEYSHYIEITDGQHTATFINNGESVLTLDNFVSGQNPCGSKFWMTKADHALHFNSAWGTQKAIKQQKEALRKFIDMCMSIKIFFDDIDEIVVYTV